MDWACISAPSNLQRKYGTDRDNKWLGVELLSRLPVTAIGRSPKSVHRGSGPELACQEPTHPSPWTVCLPKRQYDVTSGALAACRSSVTVTVGVEFHSICRA